MNRTLPRWQYQCTAGTYYNVSLIGLIWDIVAHRTHHWRHGDGWID